MNRLGEIADELTELIEELDRPELAAVAGALKVALERAFEKACIAERTLRLNQEAEQQQVRQKVRPRRRVAGGAGDGRSGVVIQLPLAWRLGVAASRRLND